MPTKPLGLRTSAFAIAVLVVVAPASAVTVTGSAPIVGTTYGYQYTATWTATAGTFSFVPFYSFTAVGYGGFPSMTIGGQFVGPSTPLAVQSFDFTADVTMSFVDAATGAPAIPAGYGPTSTGENQGFWKSVAPVGATRLTNSTITGEVAVFQLGGARIEFVETTHFAAGQYLSGGVATFDQLDASGAGNFSYSLSTNPAIPEPSSYALVLAGVAALTWRRQMSRRREPRQG